jgi:hypothetical protein
LKQNTTPRYAQQNTTDSLQPAHARSCVLTAAPAKFSRRERGFDMRLLGSLTGNARLHIDDRDLGEVVYSINVGMEEGAKCANGVFSGNERAIVAAGVNHEARLALKTGEVIPIDIKEANLVRAIFSVRGEVPGF